MSAAARRVVVINDASVARGGATGLALLSARLLAARGLEVTYVAGDDGDAPALAGQGIEVVGAGGARLLEGGRLRAMARGLHNAAARDTLADVIARQDSPETVYHVHGWAQIHSPAIFAALAPVARRVLVHAHDFFLACPNGVYMDFQKLVPCTRVPLGASCLATHCDKRSYGQKLWRVGRQVVLRRRFAARAPWAGIVMIHPGMRAGLERAGYPPPRLVALRNPATAFRADRIAAERNRGLVFVGRIEPDKGVRQLIAAARRAGMPLRVIGDGPLRDALRAAHPDVAFPGWKTRREIATLIADARALVLPTRAPEPFGLVVAEASLSGLPVVVSDTALLAPEITANGLGLACDVHDPDAFTAALIGMRDMAPGAVRAMSEKAHAGHAGLAQNEAAWAAGLHALYDRAVAGLPLAAQP